MDSHDALAWSPAGFIWNDAADHGLSIADFGEYTTAKKQWKDPAQKKEPKFLDCYGDFIRNENKIAYGCDPDIEALRPYIMTNTIRWDLDVPDIWRAAHRWPWSQCSLIVSRRALCGVRTPISLYVAERSLRFRP